MTEYINVTVQTTQPRKISVKPSTVAPNLQITVDPTQQNAKISRDWAIGDGLIQNEDYSSKTWAGESKSSADLSKMYSEAASLDLTNLENRIIEYDEQLSTTITEGLENINTSVTSGVSTLETLQANSLAEITTNKESALSDIDINKTNTLAQISTLANTSISDINAVAKSYDNLTHKNITNCLLEVPQRIKYDLTDGTLTVKAGSVVIVPYGVEDLTSQYPKGATFINDNFKVYDTQFEDGKFFVWAELVGDISRSSFSENGNILIFVNINDAGSGTNGLGQAISTNVGSGTSDPSKGYYYRTDENKVYHLGAWYGYSLPVAVGTANGTILTSVNQVFNGFGYIGSTIWVDKGVKGLIPNGRDEDGSLKNIEVTSDKLYLRTYTTGINNTNVNFIFQPNNTERPIGYALSSRLVSNWEDINYIKDVDGTIYQGFMYATGDVTNGVITSFNPKQPFRITDNAVSKYGDTMNEGAILTLQNLNATTYGGINVHNNYADATQGTVSAQENYMYINCKDKNANLVGEMLTKHATNGVICTVLRAFNYATGSQVKAELQVGVDVNGKAYAIAPASAATNSIVTTTGIKKAANGYVKLGNGIIVQWGKTASNSSSAYTVTLPTAFTSTNYKVVMTQSGTALTSSDWMNSITVTTLTTSNFQFISYVSEKPQYNWLAIGY